MKKLHTAPDPLFFILVLMLGLALFHNRVIAEYYPFFDFVGLFKKIGGAKLIATVDKLARLYLIVSLPGWIAGNILARLVIRSPRLSQALLRFLRLALWLPLFGGWHLLSAQHVERQYPLLLFWIWSTGVAAVALSSCYYALAARVALKLNGREARRFVMNLTARHALLVSLLLDFFVWPADWFVYPGSNEPVINYAVFIVLALFLILLDRVFPSTFERAADIQRIIVSTQASFKTTNSLYVVSMFVFLLAWQIFSVVGVIEVTPMALLLRLYNTLILGTSVREGGEFFWKDIGVSFFEIIGGIISAGIAATVIFRLAAKEFTRNRIVTVLPIMYVAPIVLLPGWFGLSGFFFVWWSSLCVAVLSLFPFMQGLWAMRDQAFLPRLFLALDQALPFAFIGVIHGEATSAVAGLGFSMTVATAASDTVQAFSAFVVLVVLFVSLSSVLRWAIARSLHLKADDSSPFVAPEGVHATESSL